jgi:thiol-disulfide isomerase/thioredoxin
MEHMSTRRVYLLWAAALTAIAALAVAFAGRTAPTRLAGVADPENLPVGRELPSIVADGWLNTGPLAARDLRGRVVVVDFWTYSCVNCVRTIPHLRAWWDRYRRDGLVILGVHSPEFEFEKNDANVAAASQRLGVTWPVAYDDDMDIWDTFANQYWPAKYVFDRDGRLRFTHFGEGAYEDTENVLRALLGVADDAPRAGAPGEPAPLVPTITRETYLGVQRGGIDFISPGGLREGEHDYDAPATIDAGQTALRGAWEATDEYIESRDGEGTLVLGYNAREVNLVMTIAGTGGAIDVVVELDGGPVPEAMRGASLTVDGGGRTVARVSASDLYALVSGEQIGQHTLRLSPTRPGLRAFAFTFG